MLGLLCVLLLTGSALAQPKSGLRLPPPVDLIKAAEEGKAFTAMLLAQPPQNATNMGVLRIRPAGGSEREIPVRVQIVSGPAHWTASYLAMPDGKPSSQLTITHAHGQPTTYLLADAGTNAPRQLAPNQTMLPFAGSDFWLADLGLEFLHWPKQYLLRKEMRHSIFCNVLESVQPQPAPGGYARVLAWFQAEPPYGLIHADAFDARNQLLKIFDPTELAKVNGEHQVEELEMQNRQTGSRTRLKFNLP